MNTILQELSGNIIAFIAGLIFFKSLSTAGRVILLQVTLALAAELCARFFMPVNNGAIYKWYMLADRILLMLAGYFFIGKKSLYPILAAMAGYTLYWFITADLIRVYILSSALQVIIYFFVLYHAATNSRSAAYKIPGLWIAVGIIIFYACNIPYFSMINYVVKLEMWQQNLLHIILICLAHFRYLFTAIGFYVSEKTK